MPELIACAVSIMNPVSSAQTVPQDEEIRLGESLNPPDQRSIEKADRREKRSHRGISIRERNGFYTMRKERHENQNRHAKQHVNSCCQAHAFGGLMMIRSAQEQPPSPVLRGVKVRAIEWECMRIPQSE